MLKKLTKEFKKPRILIAPLDWGLGHATRCIPIINVLIQQNVEVLLAAEGGTASLLKKEFPGIEILSLKGYKVRYSSSKSLFFLNMLRQVPKLINAVGYEKRWLKKKISMHQIDAVISDNRFGLHSDHIPCVYITHQLYIHTGIRALNKLAQKINYRFIEKFDQCWIPDVAGKKNLAGRLSHPEIFPTIPVKYLGILSRGRKIITEKKYYLLIMLSGPEPQRTIFENILLKQLKDMSEPIVIVRGLPGNDTPLTMDYGSIIVYNHLPTHELIVLLQQAEHIVARCGYSTIMDLVTLQQQAILVPTPGQAEQEYLAGYLKENKIFFTIRQENFFLKKAIEDARRLDYSSMEIFPALNENIILDWLKEINS